ncbi:hypothetical protein SARC_10037 [Sphaeroforma arctica JP610]|uniref:Uncharacterized protein n=1 Tax=Sphaeroforma arctica JP610 TaxID=667725 RepID=A0A0L0FL37_9EUKA|nr:hypothetical protein SARC_10037 [Sphaeroforma arctica JP610]KNC77502.1 hypothetical protein SARC_10037 [Sphaeroforma arctica JP610]|eukprot:XP_014151404.1 hypothetical protein SARC_10037 [Sphaeroforma arctica JP610]
MGAPHLKKGKKAKKQVPTEDSGVDENAARPGTADYVCGGDFGKYFEEQYGEERWATLKEALVLPGDYIVAVTWRGVFEEQSG